MPAVTRDHASQAIGAAHERHVGADQSGQPRMVEIKPMAPMIQPARSTNAGAMFRHFGCWHVKQAAIRKKTGAAEPGFNWLR